MGGPTAPYAQIGTNASGQLGYLNSDGSDYNSTLTSLAQNLLTTCQMALAGGGEPASRVRELLNSKYNIYYDQTTSADLSNPNNTTDMLYAYVLAGGSTILASNLEKQPSNTIGVHISLSSAALNIPATIITSNGGVAERSPQLFNGTLKRLPPPPSLTFINGPTNLTVIHEMNHAWQAMHGLLSNESILVFKNGNRVGFPLKVENDAQVVTNMFAIRNGMSQFVQKFYVENTLNPDGTARLNVHEINPNFTLDKNGNFNSGIK
jgi:hypothetical protein